MAGPFYAAVLTLLIMILAFYWHRMRRFHITVMVSVMVFDLAMPIYLVSTRDWYTRLIVHADILSFGVWAHFGLLVSLFVLYAMQIQTALKILKPVDQATGDNRAMHRAQAKGVLLVRTLVIVSGALLAEPLTPS